MVQKHPIQEFNGIKFYKKPAGYYKADYQTHGGLYMHRFVWEYHNGKIPDGEHIHHINGNKSDNTIENLGIMDGREHISYHTKKTFAENPELGLRGIRAAQEAAKIWHRSKAGREWHSIHGTESWVGKEMEEYDCTVCGQKYSTYKGYRKKGYCSPVCQNKARHLSGVDDIVCICSECRAEFKKNNYRKTKTCSICCAVAAAKKTKSSIRSNRRRRTLLLR